MADQVLQGAEGDARRDVEASVVQHSDLVMFDGVSGLNVPDRQRIASCRQTPAGVSSWEACGGLAAVCEQASSPFVVSLSRIMKEPRVFPGASSCLSASFLLMPLKNHLKKTRTQKLVFIYRLSVNLKKKELPHSSVSRVSLAT